VERVAAALEAADTKEIESREDWYKILARAAIAAMREPTEEMETVVGITSVMRGVGGISLQPKDAESNRAIIKELREAQAANRAALKEPT